MRIIIYTAILGVLSIIFPVYSSAQLFMLEDGDYLAPLANTSGRGIVLDDECNVYITGFTRAVGFPCRSAYQTRLSGDMDAFVVKLSSSGSRIIYATYLGGSGSDDGYDIAVNKARDVFITGETTSSDFPTINAYQAVRAGQRDAFISKIDSSGSLLIYSGYLGGGQDDTASSLALDLTGSIYIGGETLSGDFPTENAYQASKTGWEQDVFVCKMTSSGSSMVFSTFLGGNKVDSGGKIALDQADHIYVVGTTRSDDFPTRNCYSPSRTGEYDAFVVKFSSSGSNLMYSTYLGGAGSDFGNDIAVDRSASAHIVGFTLERGFPEKNPLFSRHDEDGAAFISKLASSGSILLFSSCWGTEGGDAAMAVALDHSGCAYVAGITGSYNFPLRNPYQSSKRGRMEVFVAKLNSSNSDVIYSTYLGGLDYERPSGLVVDSSGCAYLTGCTYSCDFPVRDAFRSSLAGGADAFITGFTSSGSGLLFSSYLGDVKK